jgi:hypothetical protein
MQNYAEIVQPHEVFESVSKKPLILAIVFTLAGLCVSSEAIFGQSAVRASQGVLDGNKIKDVEAIYPNMARVAHVQGDVVLRAAISKTGVVENLFGQFRTEELRKSARICTAATFALYILIRSSPPICGRIAQEREVAG